MVTEHYSVILWMHLREAKTMDMADLLVDVAFCLFENWRYPR
jgi:hypothetical protein